MSTFQPPAPTTGDWYSNILRPPESALCLSCGAITKPIGHGFSSKFFLGTIETTQLFIQLTNWSGWNIKPTDGVLLYDMNKYICGRCANAQVVEITKALQGDSQ